VTAIDLHYSLSEIITKMSKQYLLFFFSYLIVKEVPLNKVKWLFFSILASVTIMAVYACYQFYEAPLFFTNRVQGFTGAFYRLSTFLVLSIPVVIVLAFSLRGWLKRIILVLLPILFAALFFTFTRGAWIAAIIEILTLTVIFSTKYRKLFFLSVAAALLIVTGLSYKCNPQKLITRGSEKPRIEVCAG
jgi:O-antigen ligase